MERDRVGVESAPEERRDGLALKSLAVLLAAGLLYVALTWGYTSSFWGDYGRWLHEMDRFARGETLYRDYLWPFPPLAVWVVGGVQRALGVGLTVVWATMAVVFLVILVGVHRWTWRVAPREVAWAALIGAVALGVVQAQLRAAPLPAGMYAPAAPIGFLCLLGALVVLVELPRVTRVAVPAALAGALAGGALLSKQDFWVPAVTAVMVGPLVLLTGRARVRAAAWALAGLAASTGAGAGIVWVTAGPEAVVGMAHGFGMVNEVGSKALPSAEAVVRLAAATGWVLLGGMLLFRALGVGRPGWGWVVGSGVLAVVSTGLHVGVTATIVEEVRAVGLPRYPDPTRAFAAGFASEVPSLRLGVVHLRDRLREVPIPSTLPFLAAVAFGAWWFRQRRPLGPQGRVIVFALVVCMAARSRRVFQWTEWYHVMLEVPTYAAVLALVLEREWTVARRAVVAAALALVPVAAYQNYAFGFGLGSARGVWEPFETPRGTVRWDPGHVDDLRWAGELLDRIDPSGTRPLLSPGFTGGFNYFLDRPNPTELTHGWAIRRRPVEQILEDLRPRLHEVFLLGNRAVRTSTGPVPGLHLAPWHPPYGPSMHARADLPVFQELVSGCARVGFTGFSEAPFFQMYDCARAPADSVLAGEPETPIVPVPPSDGRGSP